MNKVTITANPETGNVFTPNENVGKDGKQYGYFRVESNQLDMSNGFASVRKRSALIAISAEDFQGVKGRLTANSTLDGQVIHMDSLTEEKGYRALRVPSKENKDVLISVKSDGQQVYRKTIFDPTNTLVDTKLVYDKQEATVGTNAPKATVLAGA
jgi:hypothetical protein